MNTQEIIEKIADKLEPGKDYESQLCNRAITETLTLLAEHIPEGNVTHPYESLLQSLENNKDGK